jgi:hypothetical protein
MLSKHCQSSQNIVMTYTQDWGGRPFAKILSASGIWQNGDRARRAIFHASRLGQFGRMICFNSREIFGSPSRCYETLLRDNVSSQLRVTVTSHCYEALLRDTVTIHCCERRLRDTVTSHCYVKRHNYGRELSIFRIVTLLTKQRAVGRPVQRITSIWWSSTAFSLAIRARAPSKRGPHNCLFSHCFHQIHLCLTVFFGWHC